MKNYLELIPQAARVHKKQSRMTRLCILLTVFLTAVIFGMADMEIRNQKTLAVRDDGSWHVVFRGLSEEQEALIRARPQVAEASSYGVLNYRLDEAYQIGDHLAAVCGFEEGFLKLYPAISFVEGGFPTKEGEAAITQNVKEQMGLQTGDTVVLQTPDQGSCSFTVSGVVADSSRMLEYDAYGIFLNMDTYLKNFSAHTLKSDRELYVQFKPFVNIQDTLKDICDSLELPAEQVGQNAKLLMLMFQSDNPYFQQLYQTAAVLAVLVMISGILMITSSLNSSVSQRTEFFGMLRCLGADGGQIRKYVRLEALNWCRTAVPLGLFLSMAVIWSLCGLLRFLSPSYFEGIPVFGISWPGLIAGALTGGVTVLFAARSPAKKAAMVSPLTALSGNADSMAPVKKPARSRFFSIETVLGIHHAKGSKKNLLLMTGSFAFSILLFLAFTTAMDFMNHAIRPLKPYAADLSIVSADESLSVPKELAKELQKEPAVKKVYGRSFAYDVPVTVSGRQGTVFLISYEENQFAWAEDQLLTGSVEKAQAGEGLLAAYGTGLSLQEGDRICLELGGKQVFQEITGVLSETPFTSTGGSGILICSEAFFQAVTGESDYTILDLQLNRDADEEAVERIRKLTGEGNYFSDRRMSNQEARGAYYAFALFVYGFLILIVLISVIHIMNSIQMSVSAKLRQLGAMHAIGMTTDQMLLMTGAEAAVYGGLGCILGCILGLPLHALLYQWLVTSKWGDAWSFPAGALGLILAVVCGSVAAAVAGAAKSFRKLPIV